MTKIQQITNSSIGESVNLSIEALEELKWHSQLIDMAIQLTNEFSEKNFDRIAVLLDAYQGFLTTDLDTLQFELKQLKKHIDNA
ncbi:hypothetical protein H5968_03430 [Sphaerospermopsis sp. LEGE 00249]|uniref:hypothetical protein n=1 Tax=Sphaerospermopsis sp. LEGE 00249 TaxID=1380707 RepID=UPI00164CF84B|nr:hypothetical protein [Sphaerospermopsis sp. LEGE 00249]MBC5794220.1 hypothetical protein [Sphaerospermopsis sp. LEGE 00249]